jgi:hypothetical protein
MRIVVIADTSVARRLCGMNIIRIDAHDAWCNVKPDI